ncbi:amino acid permease [Yinghuangia aomiensis]
MWLYVMAWTSFGVEVCATFAPEYKDTVRAHVPRTARRRALLSSACSSCCPSPCPATSAKSASRATRPTFYVGAFQDLIGGAADLMVVFLIASLLLIMITGLADGSRVLYNMGKEGTTIKQVGVLNRRGVPARALTVALVINILALVFLKTPLAIVVTGNLGYILTHILAISGYAMLRKDRPDLARPIKLPGFFVPLAWVLAAFLTAVLVVGATGFKITGYGGYKELGIALGVLATSVGLWLYRTKVQDRR